MAAEKVNITWVVGLNGKSRVTFQVFFRRTDESQQRNFEKEMENPIEGMKESFLLIDLSPETEYEIFVRRENQNKGDNQADSENIIVMTRSEFFVSCKNYPSYITGCLLQYTRSA